MLITTVLPTSTTFSLACFDQIWCCLLVLPPPLFSVSPSPLTQARPPVGDLRPCDLLRRLCVSASGSCALSECARSAALVWATRPVPSFDCALLIPPITPNNGPLALARWCVGETQPSAGKLSTCTAAEGPRTMQAALVHRTLEPRF
jgi:hypothetical protein